MNRLMPPGFHQAEDHRPVSTVVRGAIQGKSFRDARARRLAHELGYIECCALHGISGFAGSWRFNILKDAHEREYEAILKELKPREHKRHLERKARDRADTERERKDWQAARAKERNERRRMWVSLGGKA